MNNSQIVADGNKYVMNTYSRFPIAIVEGKGANVWDADGNEYLDFVSGIAVNALGHCDSRVVNAVVEQSNNLLHCSNLYWNEPQVKLAKLLADHSVLQKTFFCNSGAEANEAAIKIARKYGKKHHGENCYKIISMKKSFHGRTLATLTATGQEKIQKGFRPLPDGFMYTPLNDFAALQAVLTEDVCAIMLEPIQGEGGVNLCCSDFLQKVKKLCIDKNILLIFDEVQCGLGRSGSLFCYENYQIEPDVITLAKALGGGLAIGAMLAKDDVAAYFAPGDHGSTFGGNPLACAAALASLSTIIEENLSQKAKIMGEYLMDRLNNLVLKYSFIKEVRGLGLLVGMELEIEASPIVKECVDNGLLLLTAGKNVLRFLPPLNVTEAEIEKAVNILNCVFSKMS